MKKVLLMLLAVFAIGSNLCAKGVYEYRLGEELTLDQVKDGTTPFVLVRASDTKLIVYGTNGNQYAMKNLAEVAETDLAYYFKMVPIKGNATYEEKLGEARELAENAFDGDESNDALYMIRPYKRDNNPFSVWGKSNMYVAHCGWTTNANSIDPDALKFGDDAKYGCIWKVIASANGYTIQNQSIDNKNYLTGNGGPGASTDWKFYSVTQVLVANTSWTWTKISFEDALTSEDPVVLVQNDLVITNSNNGVNYSTKEEFDNFAYWVKFEAYNAGENQYYITLNNENGEKVNYFNASVWSHVFLSGIDKEGTRGEKQNGGVFTIAEMGENQYSIRNLGAVEGAYGEEHNGKGYVNLTTDGYWKNNATWQNASPVAWEFYALTNKQIVPIDPNTPTYDKVDADLTTFALSKLNGNNWHFDTPADLFDYKYLVVVTKESSGNKNGYMILTDNTGKRAGNNWGSDLEINYEASAAGTRGGMWLDRWNNQICACINLAWIREQGLDIRNITNFSIPNASNIAGVFLTNYAEGNATKNAGGAYPSGDHRRSYDLLDEETAKFGTIALKYTSVVSGAKLYTVDSFDPVSGMVLAEKDDYIAEAGVPYIFLTCDFEGYGANGGSKGTQSNVNFFRVDANAVSGDWSDNNARDNGLVGYYDGGFWPGAGALNGTYLLAQNQLHLVDGGEINLGTNRCFFDPGKYQGPKSTPGAKVRVGVAGAEETAIKNVQNAVNDGKIYDMNGREVKSVEKGGMYIMGGMKVYIKK